MNARVHIDRQPQRWRNMHETVEVAIDRLYDVWNPDVSVAGRNSRSLAATVRALQGIVGDAMRSQARVKAIGSGWSLSEVVATDGWIVNTKPLDWVFSVARRDVVDAYRGDANGLFLMQCGVSIARLTRNLRAAGRSLRTQGASNGQTIAGAVSTGTHGSALPEGGLQDSVVGLHLIPGPTRSVWIERESRPVVTDAFVARLNAERIRSDAVFDAALVGLGGLGIVHAVLLETDPIYLLEGYRTRVPLDPSVRAAIEGLRFDDLDLPDRDARPHHFAAVINPYDPDGHVYTTVMYKRAYRDDYPRIEREPRGRGPGEGFLHFVGQLSDGEPALIPTLVNAVMTTFHPTYSGLWGTLGEFFSYSRDLRGGATGSAFAVPLERTRDALDLVRTVFDATGPYACVFGIRYARGTHATLGFTRFDTNCVIDLDGVDSGRTRDFFTRVWDALEHSDIPHAFHWGKAGPFAAARVRGTYGDAVDRWIGVREQLLVPEARRVFSSRFLDQAGLG